MTTAIVLLHDYNGHPGMMEQIRNFFFPYVDQVLNISLYTSIVSTTGYSLANDILSYNRDGKAIITNTLVENLWKALHVKLNDNIDKIHFIGHSMGGLVARSFVQAVVGPPDNMWLGTRTPEVRTITQLASPNKGTSTKRFRTSTLSEYANEKLFGELAQLKNMEKGSVYIQMLNRNDHFESSVPLLGAIGSSNKEELPGFDGIVFHDEFFIKRMHRVNFGAYADMIDHFNIINWGIRTNAIDILRSSVLSFIQKHN